MLDFNGGTCVSYDIMGHSGKSWTCNQWAWPEYLKIATAFGWVPEGAFFKSDEAGFGPHPSGSYLGNDWQQVTDSDARAFAAALLLAIATIKAVQPMTDRQLAALRAFKLDTSEPCFERKELGTGVLMVEADYFRINVGKVCTVQTCREIFCVNVCPMMRLADVAAAGGFTIA
jgi:hypothetical protein